MALSGAGRSGIEERNCTLSFYDYILYRSGKYVNILTRCSQVSYVSIFVWLISC